MNSMISDFVQASDRWTGKWMSMNRFNIPCTQPNIYDRFTCTFIIKKKAVENTTKNCFMTPITREREYDNKTVLNGFIMSVWWINSVNIEYNLNTLSWGIILYVNRICHEHMHKPFNKNFLLKPHDTVFWTNLGF